MSSLCRRHYYPASGEISAWATGAYLSTPQATRLLTQSLDLDTPDRRRALSRLVGESQSVAGELPKVVRRRLQACASQSRWREPLTLAELSQGGLDESADAWLVLNRHSGEVLESQGAANVPMPYGSVLKPFVAAAGSNPPRLPSDPRRDTWACGERVPKTMGLDEALWRSCNGYFLDWDDATARSLGEFGPLFLALGLGRLPHDMAEAIGAKPTLALSPWAVAQAYRALAAARPDVLATLQHTATVGTLQGLPASSRLARFGIKTGTVRDALSRPRVGWIVAVMPDLIAVMTRRERMPRQFATEFADAVAPWLNSRAETPVTVQVFGLVPAWQVQVECRGVGVTVSAPVTIVAAGWQPLMALAPRGPALCLGAPWLVQLPTQVDATRQYAGSFAHLALPPPALQASGTAKEQRARRGSELLFTSSLMRYAAGVLKAEDSGIVHEARNALLQVIAHNVTHSRHRERAVCDTTHCQVFLGTAAPAEQDSQTLARDWLAALGWLLFSQGGDEPWQELRPRTVVTRVLGDNPTNFHFDGERVHYHRTVSAGDSLVDEAVTARRSHKAHFALPKPRQQL